MKEGLARVDQTTRQFRYSSGTTEEHVQPISTYVAAERILYGHAVAMATKSELSSSQLSSAFTYVKRANSAVHEQVLGVATNTANEGGVVYVQPYGKFTYEWDGYDGASRPENRRGKRPNASNVSGSSAVRGSQVYSPPFTYEDVGKPVYVLYKATSTLPYESSDTVHVTLANQGASGEKNTQDRRGELTVDEVEAHRSHKGVLQVGFVADAPRLGSDGVTDLSTDEKKVIIEIAPAKDARGPIDHTQFEAVLGEDVWLSVEKPIRAFAFGKEVASSFKFTFTISPQNTQLGNFPFIVVYRRDGAFAFYRLGNATGPTFDAEENGIFQTKFGSNNEAGPLEDENFLRKLIMVNPYDSTSNVGGNIDLKNTTAVEACLENALEFLSIPINQQIISFSKTGTSLNETYVVTVSSTMNVGWFDVYVSEHAKSLVSVSVGSHGSSGTFGKVVLADCSEDERADVAGVYYGGVYNANLAAGRLVLLMRQGEFTLPDESPKFTSGGELFLGFDGVVSDVQEASANATVKVGSIKNASRAIIDVNERRYYANDQLPVGYVKRSLTQAGLTSPGPEFGFKLMDGTTLLDNANGAYDILIARLLEQYNESDLAFNGTKFVIPRATIRVGSVDYYAQIKYVNGSVFYDTPRVPAIYKSGVLTGTKPATVQPVDITSLVKTAIVDSLRVDVDIASLSISLYVKFDGDNYREVPAFDMLYNGVIRYGYGWKIIKDVVGGESKFTLEMEAYDGLGVCHSDSKSIPPTPALGAEYKLVVVHREFFARQYDVETLFLEWANEHVQGGIQEIIHTVVKQELQAVEATSLKVEANSGNTEVSLGSVAHPADLDLVIASSNVRVNGSLTFESSSSTNRKVKFEGNGLFVSGSNVGDYVAYGDYELIPKALLKVHEEKTVTESSTTTVHGITNGRLGNVNAKQLAGINVGKQHGATYQYNVVDADAGTSSYVPYVRDGGGIGLGDSIFFYKSNVHVADVVVSRDASRSNLTLTLPSQADLGGNFEVRRPGTNETLAIKGNFDQSEPYEFSFKKKVGSTEELASVEMGKVKVGTLSYASSKDYKFVLAEDVNSYGTNSTDLDYQTETYKETFASSNLDITRYYPDKSNSSDTNIWRTFAERNLGSALQALYELPLAYFHYRTDDASLKEYVGIITEKVRKVREILEPNAIDGDNNEVDIGDRYYSSTGLYKYTKDQLASIIRYSDLLTDNENKAQNMIVSVGILLKGAKETQDRLLKLEASTFGRDAPTIPGETDTDASKKPINLITNSDPEYFNQEPTKAGLNRLVKALAEEVFLVSDPTTLASSTTGYKHPSLSRLDRVDKAIYGIEADKDDSDDDLNKASTADIILINSKQDGVDKADNIIKNSGNPGYSIQNVYPDSGIIDSSKDYHSGGNTYPIKIYNNREGDSIINAYGTSARSFNGVNDALNRIVNKVNALTYSINGKDDINRPPVRLNNLRENVKSLFKQVFAMDPGDEEGTEGGASVTFGQSVLDFAISELFGYTVYQVDKTYQTLDRREFNSYVVEKINDSYSLDQKTKIGYQQRKYDTNYNSIATSNTAYYTDHFLISSDNHVRGRVPQDNLGEIFSKNYASIIDIIVDSIGITSLPRYQYNKNNTYSSDNPASESIEDWRKNKRYSETVTKRLYNLEVILDQIVKTILNRNDNNVLTDDSLSTYLEPNYSNIDSINKTSSSTSGFYSGSSISINSINLKYSSIQDLSLYVLKKLGISSTSGTSFNDVSPFIISNSSSLPKLNEDLKKGSYLQNSSEVLSTNRDSFRRDYDKQVEVAVSNGEFLVSTTQNLVRRVKELEGELYTVTKYVLDQPGNTSEDLSGQDGKYYKHDGYLDYSKTSYDINNHDRPHSLSADVASLMRTVYGSTFNNTDVGSLNWYSRHKDNTTSLPIKYDHNETYNFLKNNVIEEITETLFRLPPYYKYVNNENSFDYELLRNQSSTDPYIGNLSDFSSNTGFDFSSRTDRVNVKQDALSKNREFLYFGSYKNRFDAIEYALSAVLKIIGVDDSAILKPPETGPLYSKKMFNARMIGEVSYEDTFKTFVTNYVDRYININDDATQFSILRVLPQVVSIEKAIGLDIEYKTDIKDNDALSGEYNEYIDTTKKYARVQPGKQWRIEQSRKDVEDGDNDYKVPKFDIYYQNGERQNQLYRYYDLEPRYKITIPRALNDDNEMLAIDLYKSLNEYLKEWGTKYPEDAVSPANLSAIETKVSGSQGDRFLGTGNTNQSFYGWLFYDKPGSIPPRVLDEDLFQRVLVIYKPSNDPPSERFKNALKAAAKAIDVELRYKISLPNETTVGRSYVSTGDSIKNSWYYPQVLNKSGDLDSSNNAFTDLSNTFNKKSDGFDFETYLTPWNSQGVGRITDLGDEVSAFNRRQVKYEKMNLDYGEEPGWQSSVATAGNVTRSSYLIHPHFAANNVDPYRPVNNVWEEVLLLHEWAIFTSQEIRQLAAELVTRVSSINRRLVTVTDEVDQRTSYNGAVWGEEANHFYTLYGDVNYANAQEQLASMREDGERVSIGLQKRVLELERVIWFYLAGIDGSKPGTEWVTNAFNSSDPSKLATLIGYSSGLGDKNEGTEYNKDTDKSIFLNSLGLDKPSVSNTNGNLVNRVLNIENDASALDGNAVYNNIANGNTGYKDKILKNFSVSNGTQTRINDLIFNSNYIDIRTKSGETSQTSQIIFKSDIITTSVSTTTDNNTPVTLGLVFATYDNSSKLKFNDDLILTTKSTNGALTITASSLSITNDTTITGNLIVKKLSDNTKGNVTAQYLNIQGYKIDLLPSNFDKDNNNELKSQIRNLHITGGFTSPLKTIISNKGLPNTTNMTNILTNDLYELNFLTSVTKDISTDIDTFNFISKKINLSNKKISFQIGDDSSTINSLYFNLNNQNEKTITIPKATSSNWGVMKPLISGDTLTLEIG